MNTLNRKRKLDQTLIHKLYHDVRSKDPTRENFLKRLQTYDVFNWSGKPVDPPQCALFGWEIAEKDVLKCVMCHQFLSVALPSPTKDASYKQACSQLKTKLASAHSKFCLYSANQVPDSVLEIEPVSNMQLLDTIEQQLLALKNVETCCRVPDLQDEVKEIFDWFLGITTLSEVHLSSFTFVLTGWKFLKDDMLLKCNYCNRKWSIEPYLSQKNSSEKNNSVRSAVDPIAQHQRWCAWRAPTRGWESRLLQLQQLKESRCREKRSRLSSDTCDSLTDRMRTVRKLLNGTL